MPTVACDAKHFERGRRTRVDDQQEYSAFKTPLGAAVWFKNDKEFLASFISTSASLARSFQLESSRPFFSSELLKERLGMEKALAFADQLVTAVSNHIQTVHLTYVVIPPKQFPTVSVLGYRTTSKEISTELFFESLGPMFSYLTAFSFLGGSEQASEENWNVLIDSFRSKSTVAWSDLTKRVTPKVFIRGDECNPFICLADLIAFLTDCKLYGRFLKLSSENLANVFEQYPFNVNVHWFDARMLFKIKWYDNTLIDFSKYLARPVIYVLIDPVERYFQTEIKTSELQSAGEEFHEEGEMNAETFRELVERSEVFEAVLNLAYKRGGCAKVYTNEDQKMVRDGDILVYVGNKAKEAAQTFSHMYDVEVLSGKDVRRQVFQSH